MSAVINSKHIEPRIRLFEASEIVLEHVHNVMQRYDSVKINIVFNDEFMAGDKRANKSIATRNYEYINTLIYANGTCRASNLSYHRWKSFRNAIANRHCILNLMWCMVNANKHNPLRTSYQTPNYAKESGNQRANRGQCVFHMVCCCHSTPGSKLWNGNPRIHWF